MESARAARLAAHEDCASTKDLDDPDHRCLALDANSSLVGLLLDTAHRLRRAIGAGHEQEPGLSGQSFEIILRLEKSDDHRLRMSDLAIATGLSPSGLTRAVDRLEHAELVRRESCPSDRRGSFAALTPLGAMTAADAAAQRERDVGALLGGILTDEQRLALEGLLETVRSRLAPNGGTDDDARCPGHDA